MLLFEVCDRAFKERTLAKMESQITRMQTEVLVQEAFCFFPGVPLVNVQLQKNIFSVLSAHFVVFLSSWKPVNTEVMFGKSVTCRSLHSRITNFSHRKGNLKKCFS